MRASHEYYYSSLRWIFVLFAFSLNVHVGRVSLRPLYGSAADAYSDYLVLAILCLSAVLPTPASSPATLAAAVYLLSSPFLTFWIGSSTARWGYPVVGSLLTRTVVLAPTAHFLLLPQVETVGYLLLDDFSK